MSNNKNNLLPYYFHLLKFIYYITIYKTKFHNSDFTLTFPLKDNSINIR